MGWLPPEWPKTIVAFEKRIHDESGNPASDEQGIAQYAVVGTGTLISHEKIPFVVTCKHVVDRVGQDLYLTTNNQQGERLRKPIHFVAQMYREETGITPKWFTHPDAWSEDNKNGVDLAILPFPITATEDVKTAGEDLFMESEEVEQGDDVFLLGFPLGLTTSEQLTPIVRSGMLALRYSDDTFLIDSQVFPGNSGGPVFRRPSLLERKTEGGYQIGSGERLIAKLIGIISEAKTYTDVAYSQQTGKAKIAFEENAGLGKGFGVTYIDEILQQEETQNHINHIKSLKQDS